MLASIGVRSFECDLWEVIIDSDIGLALNRDNPLSKPMMTQFCDDQWENYDGGKRWRVRESDGGDTIAIDNSEQWAP